MAQKYTPVRGGAAAHADKVPLSEWEKGNWYDKWTFSVANKMLGIGLKKPLDYDDLMHISARDLSTELVEDFKKVYQKSKSILFIRKIHVALMAQHQFVVIITAFLTLMEGAVRVTSPLILRSLLISLGDPDQPAWRSFMFAGILGGLSILQTIVHHILFYYTMKMGWNWKSTLTALIYDRLFWLNKANAEGTATAAPANNAASAAMKASNAANLSTGKLVNLISNDVGFFELFATFEHFFWCSWVEILVIFIIMTMQLTVLPAVAGVGVTLICFPVQMKLAYQFTAIRAQTARQTDQRVRHISEVVDGISTVKSYNWEVPFYELISSFRSKERANIARAQTIKAINFSLGYASLPLAAFSTFVVYRSLGHQLTLEIVFPTLALLHVLRIAMRHWTVSLERGSEAMASGKRIENFLAMTDDVAGVHGAMDSTDVDNEAARNGHCAEKGVELVAKKAVDVALRDKVSESAVLYAVQEPKSYSYENPNLTPDSSSGNSGEETAAEIAAAAATAARNTILKGIQFSVSRGELVMCVGSVGAGKSTLLLSMLKEVFEEVPGAGTGSGVASAAETPPPAACSVATSQALRDAAAATMNYDDVHFAYCAQRPWIMAATVRENIVIGASGGGGSTGSSPAETSPEQLYALSLESCCVVEDMESWAGYDHTEIGERGISVSGGQKARIALARAVYSNADLYLLDDPLSAVDAHVGKALFFNCIMDALVKRNKGVVLATHQLQYLQYAHKIVVLGDTGEQTFYGTYEELMSRADEFPSLGLTPSPSSTATPSGGASLTPSSRSPAPGTVPPTGAAVGNTNNNIDATYVPKKYDPAYYKNSQKNTKVVAPVAADAKSKDATKVHDVELGNVVTAGEATEMDVDDEDTLAADSEAFEKKRIIIQLEDRALGTIDASVFIKYLYAGGVPRGLFAVLMGIVAQVMVMMSDYWLKWWATESFWDNQGNPAYMWVYALLVLACIIMGFSRSAMWFVFTLRASSNMHDKALWAVMRSPMQFFISNPTGRILNRFSRDQNLIDELLASTSFDFMQTALICVAAMILACVSIPYIAIIMPFLFLLFWFVRNKYIQSSREIKRIEAILRSPIYARFSASLDGLVTLRAYKLREFVTNEFHKSIDRNGRAWFSFLMVSRWIGFRLDLISAFIVLVTSILAAALRDTVDIGLIGFALVYTISLSGLFQWTVRQSAEVEAQMTSVERVCSYGSLPPEDGYKSSNDYLVARNKAKSLLDASKKNRRRTRTVSGDAVLEVNPAMVKIMNNINAKVKEINSTFENTILRIDNLTVRYRDDLEPVLNGLCLDIPAGYKVGVCGRTGCGKSSLLLALLRLNMISSGDLLLLDKNTAGDSASLSPSDKSTDAPVKPANRLSLITDIDLEMNRSLIAVIPQDPHLFSGTIRYNLDPFSVYTDEEIWSALEDAHIKDYVSRGMPIADPSSGEPTDAEIEAATVSDKAAGMGLYGVVEEQGKNFSVGQRQLLSLSRAILRKCKIILMDEVSASVDFATDKLIQTTIRESPVLKAATIITIAHRLRTIADSDMIVVINNGKVAEQGSPFELLSSTSTAQDASASSLFKQLAEQSNEFQEIFDIAKNSHDGVQWSGGTPSPKPSNNA